VLEKVAKVPAPDVVAPPITDTYMHTQEYIRVLKHISRIHYIAHITLNNKKLKAIPI